MSTNPAQKNTKNASHVNIGPTDLNSNYGCCFAAADDITTPSKVQRAAADASFSLLAIRQAPVIFISAYIFFSNPSDEAPSAALYCTELG